MGNRPRIAMPNAQQKARSNVRELYSDAIDNLSNNECDLIIKARMDGFGFIFIVELISQKRKSAATYIEQRQSLYHQFKEKSQTIKPGI